MQPEEEAQELGALIEAVTLLMLGLRKPMPLLAMWTVLALVVFERRTLTLSRCMRLLTDSESIHAPPETVTSVFIEHLAGFACSLELAGLSVPYRQVVGHRMQPTGTEEFPFTGEPHNPAYYSEPWQAAGFEPQGALVCPTPYPKVSNQDLSDKWLNALSLLKKRDSLFALQRSRRKASLQVFLNRLYQDFPIYRSLPVSSSVRFSKIPGISLIFQWLLASISESKLAGF